jgi:hypothetical protein
MARVFVRARRLAVLGRKSMMQPCSTGRATGTGRRPPRFYRRLPTDRSHCFHRARRLRRAACLANSAD